MRFGGYAPQNLDRTWLGPITARTALQASRNLPAVALLDAVGPRQLMARLRRAGDQPVAPRRRHRRPRHRPRRRRPDPRGPRPPLCRDRRRRDRAPSRRDPRRRARGPRQGARSVPAWYVADILRGTPPPPNGVAGRIAYKTGTSYGHRDAWAIGFDGAHVIGVWFGRPDGASVPGALGLETAAPALFDAFARLSPDPAPLPPPPGSALTVTASELPAPLRRFHARGAARCRRRPPDRLPARRRASRSRPRPRRWPTARHPSRRWRAAFPLARRRRAASGRSLRAPGGMASGWRRVRRSRRDRRSRTCGAGKRIPGVSSGRSESSG